MAIATTESYLAILEKSRLVTPEQFAEIREAADGVDRPKTLAKILVRDQKLTRWQAGQLLAGRSSFLLGKYKLVDLLGRGGMGSVFLAEHITMNRPVALKIIAKQLGQDPASLEQFFTEARAIAALDHPNIVHAYDVDCEGTRHYIAMEYVQGQDLQRMVEAEGPLNFGKAANYIVQTSDGLAHAHGRDMIHCDIKPANLLVNDQDVVKILDMGMARLVGHDQEASSGERGLGTVDYQAPEQAIESPQLDHRADIYSLGCTLYFLLTGQPPFPEGTLHQRIVLHQTQEPSPIDQKRPDTPKDLAQICQKMLAKDPDDRFQTAAEVAQLLADWHAPKPPLLKAKPVRSVQPAEDSELSIVEDPTTSVIARRARPRSKGPGIITKFLAACRAFYQRRPRLVLLVGLGLVVTLVLIGSLRGLGVLSSESASGPSDLATASQPVGPTADTIADDSGWSDVEPPDPEALDAILDAIEKPADQQPPEQPKPEQPKPKQPKPKQPKPKQTDDAEPDDSKPATEKSVDKEPAPAGPNSKQPAANQETAKNPPDDDTKTDVVKEGASAAKTPPPKESAAKNLFADMRARAPLPECDDAEPKPFAIGKVHADKDVNWQLFLLGGQNAMKSTRQTTRKFTLNRTEPEVAKARWAVQIEETTSGDVKTTDVATFRRAGESLMFQWVPSVDPALANYLRNCVLQIRVTGESHYLILLAPEKIEPIHVDLVRGIATTAGSVSWLPDNSNLRVQVTRVEGRKGHHVEPAEPAAPDAPVNLLFDRTDRHGNTRDRVEFQITFTVRMSGLMAKLQLVNPPATQFRMLKQQNLTILKNRIALQQTEVNKLLNPKDKDKAPKGEQRTRLNFQFDELAKGLWYTEFFEQVHETAIVHFRLYSDVEGHEVVFAVTGGPSQEKEKPDS